MAILQSNTDIPVPYIPSHDVQIQDHVHRIRYISDETFNNLINTQRNGIDLMWNSPVVTPQEVIDGLEGDAIKIFQFHAALTTFIMTLASIEGVDVALKFPTNAFNIVGNVITVTEDPFVL